MSASRSYIILRQRGTFCFAVSADCGSYLIRVAAMGKIMHSCLTFLIKRGHVESFFGGLKDSDDLNAFQTDVLFCNN
jgi:hypothetical protein